MTAEGGTKLRVVKGAQQAAKIDIYAQDKARIAAIDWGAVHLRGDRAQAVAIKTPRDRNQRIERR